MTADNKNNANLLLAMLIIIIATLFLLHQQGRIWWCKVGDFAVWSGDIWTTHNSQHFFDPYTFTHILHGVLYFWLINLCFKNLPVKWKFFLVVLIESIWEIVENSSIVIERYRAVTVSLDYFGDSIANSISDVFSCIFGAIIAYKLRFWYSFALFVFTEISLLFTIRDNLTLNILMLIYPIEAIKQWQIGK